MIKVFNSKSEYDNYTSNGTKLQSGDIYHIVEDSSYHFFTNNITGATQVVDAYVGGGSGGITPSGNLNISTNGSNIDVTEYATVAVSVPASAVVSGSLDISANGSNIDVTDYASVNVNVAASGIVPSGTLSISSNGEFDCTNYASVAVSVAAPAPSLNWQTVSTAYPYGNTVDVYLEMNAGTTYIFKSSAGDVTMYLQQSDTDGDGDVDMDDEWYCIGRMVPNKEYYLTATNEYVNYNSEYDQGKAYIYFAYNGGDSITIQYAVLN